MFVDEQLFRDKPNEALRRHAAAIFEAAVRAVDPETAVKRHIARDGPFLRVGDRSYDLRQIRRVVLIGAGKAAAPMARALENMLGDRLAAGTINVKHGYTVPLRKTSIVEAGHPIPDEAGRRGAEQILALASQTGPHDLVLCVISGGGSALLPAPVDGLSLAQKARVTELLLKCGADIQEVNTVRKHLSKIKGGQLAAASPARLIVLILSDVIGNPLDAIASGPAAPDPTTFADALGVIDRYGLTSEVPHSALDYLKRGATGLAPETPKPGTGIFAKVQTVIVGSNDAAIEAASVAARASGYHTIVLPPYAGEARVAATQFANEAAKLSVRRQPACVVAGGETTVTVRGAGRGGRCQEFALAAASVIAGRPATLVAAFGTDGTDGATDAAGAVADGSTLPRAEGIGLDARRALESNDAHTFFARLSDLIVTGPTNTNVNDVYLALVNSNEPERQVASTIV